MDVLYKESTSMPILNHNTGKIFSLHLVDILTNCLCSSQIAIDSELSKRMKYSFVDSFHAIQAGITNLKKEDSTRMVGY